MVNSKSDGDECCRMTWLGHASVLAEVDGHTILTDPIFSNRASAVKVHVYSQIYLRRRSILKYE